MKLKGIVFDLDGTLVDSLSTTFEAFNEGFTRHGGRRHTPAEIMEYFGPGEREIFARVVGEHNADSAYRIAREYTDANMHRVPLHEGIGDLLETLKSDGAPIAICTGRSWNTTELILKHHRLLDRFVTVVANDHVSAPKPAPEGILLALGRMKLEPEDIVYVGDMCVDIQAARSAGARGVAALWDSLVRREELELHQPHHWAHAPADVTELWRQLGR